MLSKCPTSVAREIDNDERDDGMIKLQTPYKTVLDTFNDNHDLTSLIIAPLKRQRTERDPPFERLRAQLSAVALKRTQPIRLHAMRSVWCITAIVSILFFPAFNKTRISPATQQQQGAAPGQRGQHFLWLRRYKGHPDVKETLLTRWPWQHNRLTN